MCSFSGNYNFPFKNKAQVFKNSFYRYSQINSQRSPTSLIIISSVFLIKCAVKTLTATRRPGGASYNSLIWVLIYTSDKNF